MSLPATTPKNLMSLLTAVRTRFVNSGIDTEILIGDEYAEDEGNGNRIVFLPIPDLGSIQNAPLRMSQLGSTTIVFGCVALIWGIGPTVEDRYGTALQILSNLTVVLPDESGDRVEYLNLLRDQEQSHSKYGEQFRFGFAYKYEVRRGTTLVQVPHPIATDTTVEPKEQGT